MRCCGISVSFVIGTTTTSESPNRKSRTVVDVDVVPETNSVTTDASDEINVPTESATTTQENLFDSLNDLNETNGVTTDEFLYNAFTTETMNETSTDSTTQNDISYTTTDIPLKTVHRDGEIIDNVMIFYPSEMSGKPWTKPDDMPIDANEFRFHDDRIGTDLHIIYPTNESEANIEAQTIETIRTPIIQADESTTQFIDVMTITPTDAPEKNLTLVTSSHELSEANIPTTDTLTSSTESAVDLKSEASELANQIENVTVRRSRYKRRKLKIQSFIRKSSTTTLAPTTSSTPIPAYKLQSRYQHTSSKSDEKPSMKSNETTIGIESTTRRVFLHRFKSLKSQNQSTNLYRRNDSVGGVDNEHELKINALQNLLTETVDATNSHNITDFLIQRRLNQNEQQQIAKRKILNQHRANPTKHLSIVSTTSMPALVIFTSTESDVASDAPTDLIATTNESLASTTPASLHARFRFNRRRNPFQGMNRSRNDISATKTTTTTEAATTTTPSRTTTPKAIQSTYNGVSNILRRRRPINRPSSIGSNPLELDVAAGSMNTERNLQQIRQRTNVDAITSSRRKLLENLRRRAIPLSTTESSAAGQLMEMDQRKRSTTTTTTEATVDTRTKSTRRYRRRKTTSATKSATTSDPIADINVKSTKENQSNDENPVETISMTHRPTTTTTTIPTTTSLEISSQPDLVANTPETKSHDAIARPTQRPKEYTEIRRPPIEQTQPTESKQTVPQLKKTETFPDMRLPDEVTKPFIREQVGPEKIQYPPSSTPFQLNPTNQVGKSSSHPDTSLQTHPTLQPTNLRPVNFLSPIAPIQYPGGISRPQSAVSIPQQYYTNQNDPLANRFHRMTSAGQSQQRPVPYIAHTNPYAGQAPPSPFDIFNFPFNFF